MQILAGLGITDKYWITTLIPQENKSFRADFDFKNKFRANFIETKPLELKPNGNVSSNVRVIVAAKEVDVIDGYAESSKIAKFDLAIDWGWFYFFTKNFFFAIDYFFKLTGNFGIAIILITICIRILFFPLANYSFRSMAKMKVLQPEMTRLKELHKDDKMKLQQEMMALYKKEKVNPVSGCLPIFIQIPFFFAIYKVLFVTLEMRHQPFYGWIEDLSERDPTSIFNLFGLIPWDPPSFLIIGVWPCLMGLTMYLQQKLNPTPPDPIQQKIFMFFPLFLTIILGSISIWSSYLLDNKQRINYGSTSCDHETDQSKNYIELMDLKKILPENGPPIDQVSKYIEKYKNDLIVIKYGGNVFIDRNIFNNFIEDISILNKLGLSIVVIHGGGPRIKESWINRI